MTRKAVIELIKQRLKSVDTSEQFPFQYIEGMCDMVWETWCSQSALDKNQDTGFFSKMYPAEAVALDSGSGYYSTTLPEQILKFTNVGSGVISVNQINAIDNDFKPVSERDFRLMKGQEVARTGSDIYYYVNYAEIRYNESMTSSIAALGVDLRLSIPFSKYLLTEELPMPSGRAMEFVGSVIELIQGTPPVNLTDKNSDS